jgi:hypothetical protein
MKKKWILRLLLRFSMSKYRIVMVYRLENDWPKLRSVYSHHDLRQIHSKNDSHGVIYGACRNYIYFLPSSYLMKCFVLKAVCYQSPLPFSQLHFVDEHTFILILSCFFSGQFSSVTFSFSLVLHEKWRCIMRSYF